MDISTLENNSYCSERVSPRRLRGNEILPPECHYISQSYCTQRISPRRQRNGCEKFAEDVLLSNIKTSSSPILVPSSSTSPNIQKEETPENQEVSVSQEVSEDQEISASQGGSVSQIPQIDDQSSSQNNLEALPEMSPEASQAEAPEPSSSSTKTTENLLKPPFSSRDRPDYINVLRRTQEFRDEMIDIEKIEPDGPRRNFIIDILNITAYFEIIIQKGYFKEVYQKELLGHLDDLTESATEVLQENIDIKEIKQKTIEAYTDIAKLILESVTNDPYNRPITIQTTGDLQAVLNKAHQLSNDLKKVPRNVSKQRTTSTVSVTDDTKETSGTPAKDIEEIIETIFDAFDILVYRE